MSKQQVHYIKKNNFSLPLLWILYYNMFGLNKKTNQKVRDYRKTAQTEASCTMTIIRDIPDEMRDGIYEHRG